MIEITKYLNNLVRDVNICMLCLQEIREDAICMYDEMLLKNNESLTIKELVNFILGQEFQDYEDSNICKDCAKASISCYNFMKTCQNAHEKMHNIVDKLVQCLPNNTTAKSIYITVSNLDFELHLDNKVNTKTKHKVLKRLKSITKKRNKPKQHEREYYELPSPGASDAMDSIFERQNDVFKCTLCLKIFHRSTNLKSHYLRVHAPKTHECPECPKKFGSAYLLRLHQSESHIIVMCSECGKTYDNIHALKMHVRSHEDKVCPTCNKIYKNNNSFKRHLSLQTCGMIRSQEYDNRTPDYRFECDICNKRFIQKGSLRVHIKFEHGNGKAYVCGWCDKKFSAQSKLKSHIVKHTRERNFTCEICGGKFVTKAALVYHTRIHTGEKPYPCPECDERFLSASRRMEHLRRKHWAPTYHCDICPSKFKTSFCLKQHKIRHFDPNSRLFSQKCTDGVQLLIS